MDRMSELLLKLMKSEHEITFRKRDKEFGHVDIELSKNGYAVTRLVLTIHIEAFRGDALLLVLLEMEQEMLHLNT